MNLSGRIIATTRPCQERSSVSLAQLESLSVESPLSGDQWRVWLTTDGLLRSIACALMEHATPIHSYTERCAELHGHSATRSSSRTHCHKKAGPVSGRLATDASGKLGAGSGVETQGQGWTRIRRRQSYVGRLSRSDETA